MFREVESWRISAVQGGITFSVYVMNVYELSDEAVSGMGITVNIWFGSKWVGSINADTEIFNVKLLGVIRKKMSVRIVTI